MPKKPIPRVFSIKNIKEIIHFGQHHISDNVAKDLQKMLIEKSELLVAKASHKNVSKSYYEEEKKNIQNEVLKAYLRSLNEMMTTNPRTRVQKQDLDALKYVANQLDF